MKFKLNPILLAIAMTGLTACGGSSSDNSVVDNSASNVSGNTSSSGNNTGSTTDSGNTTDSGDNSGSTTDEVITYKVNVAASEHLTGTLCADINQNLLCDSGEVTATLTGGTAILESEDVAVLNSQYVLVNENKFLLAAPAAVANDTSIVINPVTTLVVSNMLQGSSKEQALENVKQTLNEQFNLQLESEKLLTEDNADLANFNTEFNKLWASAQEQTSETLAVLSGLAIQLDDVAKAISENTHMESLNTYVQNALNWSRGFPMTDTGVTFYVSAEQFENEAKVAEFPGQDAEFGLDATQNDDTNGIAGFNYTKLDESGAELAADANAWSCVKDNQTGLIWEVKQAAEGPRSRDTLFVNKLDSSLAPFAGEIAEASCEDAEGICTIQQYTTHLNGLNDGAGLCGFNQWKVPSFNELYSIVNIGSKVQNDSSETLGIDVTHFPNTYAGDYWTSTRSAESHNYDTATHYVWALGFNDIYIGATYSADSCQVADDCDYPSALPVRLVTMGEVK